MRRGSGAEPTWRAGQVQRDAEAGTAARGAATGMGYGE